MPATWTVRSKIQSIARQNWAVAKMQPCRTPEDVRKLSDITSLIKYGPAYTVKLSILASSMQHRYDLHHYFERTTDGQDNSTTIFQLYFNNSGSKFLSSGVSMRPAVLPQYALRD